MSNLIAKRLTELRGKSTQIEIAAIAGVSSSSISNWETGVHYPSADAIAKLSKHWGVTADYLVGLSDFPTGLAPDSWIIDLDAYESRDPGEDWAAKVPRRHRIVDYEGLQALEAALKRGGRRRGKGGSNGDS